MKFTRDYTSINVYRSLNGSILLANLSGLEPSKVVELAVKINKKYGMYRCGEVSRALSELIPKSRKRNGKLPISKFIGNHSWVVTPENHILDATIGQYAEDFPKVLDTKIPGIYYSHPDWDGDALAIYYPK